MYGTCLNTLQAAVEGFIQQLQQFGFFFMNIFKSTLMKHFNSKFRFSNLVLMRKKRLLSLFIFQCELLLLTRNLEFKKVLATVKRYAGKETFLFLPTGCSLHDSRSFSVFN